MDKYEFNIKVEQIKKLVGKSDYETAMKIADTIDWRRVRNTNLLSMVAMVYEKNEDYEEAREILLLAFERAPIGKRLLYKLAELALKEGNIDEAEAYYREFSDLAGDDPRQQLLRYLILKAKGAPAQQLIHSLESYTSQEIDDKWLYELAELYSLAGMPERCVETCDKIMLMFGLGKYVEKAMELKIQYAPLTTYQMDLVENRDKYEAKLRAVEQEYGIGGGQMNVPEQEEEYYDDDNQDMAMPEEPDYGDLAARMQEAEVQEGLAREMSRMTYEEAPVEMPSARLDRTRVLDDIRRINRPVIMEPGYDDASMAADETAVAGAAFAGTAFAGAAAAGTAAYGVLDSAAHMAGNAERLASAMPRPRGMMRRPETAEDYSAEPMVEEDYVYGDSSGRQMNGTMGDGYGQDEEYGDPSYGNSSYGETTYEDPAYRDSEYGSTSFRNSQNGDSTNGNSSYGNSSYDNSSYGNSSSDDSSYRDAPYDKPTYGEMDYEDGDYGESTLIEAAHDEAVQGESSYGETTYGETRYGESVYGETVYGEAAHEASVQEEPSYDEAEVEYSESNDGGSDYIQAEVEYGDLKADQAATDASGNMEMGSEEEEILEIEDLEEEELPVLNHLMIEARTLEKGLKIAVEALKQIHKETGIKNPVAKITGEKLSRRGVLISAEKLAGKDLIIEEAGDLSQEALGELDDLMSRDTSGMIVVLIDNPKQMENLHRSHPRLASKFECIGSGEEYAPGEGEEYVPSSAPAQEPRRAAKTEAAPPKAAVRSLYPGRNDAPVRRQPAQVVSEAAQEPYSQPAYDDAPYGIDTYEEDLHSEESYETDSYDDQAYDGGIEEEAPKKKKGLFRNRKKPVYEELEPEEPYEDDDYYVEETEEAISYRTDGGPGSHGEEMDIDEFAQYACRYANEIDCSITGKSMLALYERIEIMEEDGVSLTRESAEGLIEEAADRAEKPSFGKRVKGIFSSKYDKDGLLILKEEHFIY